MQLVHLVFMQQQWDMLMSRVPIVGETITLDRIDTPATRTIDYEVGHVHWYVEKFDTPDEFGTMVPYVSLYKPGAQVDRPSLGRWSGTID